MSRRWIGALALVASALGGALLASEPTGTAVVDPAISAAWCVLVTLVASRAAPPAIVVAATVTGITGEPAALALAGGAAALTLWRPVVTAPLAGAALGVASLRLAWPEPFGSTALVAAAILVVLVAGAWPRLPRRATAAVVVGGAGLVLLGTAGFAVTALTHEDDLRAAVQLAEDGLSLTRSGETVEASAAFARAQELLAAAERDLDRWWVRPVAAVPVAAQHARAVGELAELAVDIVATARTATETADPDRLQIRDGTLDLAVVHDLRPALEDLHDLLDDVPRRLRRGDSPWLASPLTREMAELEDRATSEIDHLATALHATDAAPWLLGEGAQRRYFLAVMTQSELRGGGGFVGNWGVLAATDGKLELEQFGRSDDLEKLGPFDIDVSPEWNARYVDGWGVDRYFPRNVLGSPDLPSNAEAIRQASAQAGLGDIDGVIAIDPIAMATLLQITGPIEVEGWPEPLTTDNAARILMFEQYLDPLAPERLDFLSDVAQALFDRLTNSPVPEPSRLADLLDPVVGAGHLQMTAFEERASAFLHEIGMERRLEPPIGDSLAVVTAGASPTKLDWFLRRSFTYDVRTSPSGGVEATLAVTLENLAPPDLPGSYFGPSEHTDRSENRVFLSVYTPLAAGAATLDGQPLELAGSHEAGRHIHDVFVSVPPGERRTVTIELGGSLPRGYSLHLLQQPAATADAVTVVVDGATAFEGPLVEPTRIDPT